MKRLLLLLMLLPLGVWAANTPLNAVTVQPSPPPADADKTIDETGTNSYMLSYLNVAKYIHGKISGDCTVNTTSFAITCTKINGLTFPSLSAGLCLTNNGSTLSWGTCGGGGGGGGFDAITTATNTTAVMTVGTGGQLTHSGSGIVDSNYTNGTVIPTNLGTTAVPGVASTNASAQWTSQNYLALPPVTYAAAVAAVTCAAGTEGTAFWMKDANVAPGSNITAGSSTHHVLAVCDGTNWVAH